MIFRLIICYLLFTFNSFAAETCSRVAIINFQEVLVDTNTTQKGEGLRFHLEKDSKAIKYLNKYQDKTKISWKNAVLGTTGTGLLLTSLLGDARSNTKRTLLIGGASLVLINFLVAKTLKMTNEVNLLRAIQEYNKRNLPRIYFKNNKNDSRNPGSISSSIYLGKTWSF